MSDSVTNLVGNTEPRTNTTPGYPDPKAPLSDLFANVLNKTNFADRMLPQSDLQLTRSLERDAEARPEIYTDDHDHAEAAADDDAVADARDADERPDDSDADGAEGQADAQPQDDGASDTSRLPAVSSDDALFALNSAANTAEKAGLIVQPNAISGVMLQSKADGAAGEHGRVVTNRGLVQAAAQHAANADKAGAAGNDASVGAHGQNANAGANQSGPGVDAAANDKPQTRNGPVQTQSSGASAADGDGASALLEKHTMLIRAGAKRAAELHQMKIRLVAHRDTIKKVIAQNVIGSNGAQAKPALPGADKPSIELTTSATPPAPTTPVTRPTALFNSPLPTTLPGHAGANGAASLAIGDAASNGAEQSNAVADRQIMTSNTARGLNLRPMPPQTAYQPAEQVKVHIQQLVKSDSDRIQVRLSPASLGRVEVTLEIGPDKAVQAIVYAEKPETLDMLERDARVLQRAFEEAGMKFDSDSLMFKHGQSGDADTELADGAPSSEADASMDGDETDAGDAAATESPSRRQHDGMLDLEI